MFRTLYVSTVAEFLGCLYDSRFWIGKAHCLRMKNPPGRSRYTLQHPSIAHQVKILMNASVFHRALPKPGLKWVQTG